MKESSFQQILDLVNNKENILVVMPTSPSSDAIASALALFLFLRKLNKKTRLVSDGFKLPDNHQFLPGIDEINTALTAARKFIIHLDTARTEVKELSYDSERNKLNIYITPEKGFFEDRDVTTSSTSFDYDLIFIIGALDLESLGKVYEDNSELFYHTPLVNIDYHPENEYSGHINLVDITATACAEIIYDFIKFFQPDLMDEDIATDLLAGLIAKTKSFQISQVTPKSLAIASQLVNLGARREEIIKNFFQTKTMSTLKLWGRVLARLKDDFDHRLIWSLLNHQDFVKSDSREEDLSGVIEELIINTPQAEVILLLYEKADQKIAGIISASRRIDLKRFLEGVELTRDKNYFRLELESENILEAEQRILSGLRQYFSKAQPIEI
jgi:phosphoesterase RecJ-like protein